MLKLKMMFSTFFFFFNLHLGIMEIIIHDLYLFV